MNVPNDYSSPTFTVEVHKIAEGVYEATTPGMAVAASRGETEGDAIRAHSLAIHEAVQRGDAWATTSKSDA